MADDDDDDDDDAASHANPLDVKTGDENVGGLRRACEICFEEVLLLLVAE